MSAFEGFLQGFLGRTADVIKERKDKAEDYFDQAIERARTIGADNLRQRTDNYQAMLSVVNNLVTQGGMPEDIARAIANEGPQALEEAYQVYNTTAEAIAGGAEVQLNEDFWRNAYDFASEVTQGSNISLEDFLRQVNGLYPSNIAATTREGGDPFGAFIASGLGLNAMERAQDRLSEYDMGGGYSAADLLAMDARPSTTRPLGETGFGGLDREYVATQTSGPSGQIFTPEERIRMQDRFDEAVDTEVKRLYDEYVVSGGDNLNLSQNDFREEASRNVTDRWIGTLGIDGVRELPFLLPYLPDFEEDPATTDQTGDASSPDQGVTTEDLQGAGIGVTEPTTPTGSPPPAPTTVEPVVFDQSETDLTLQDGTVVRYVGTTPSGSLRYRKPDGSLVEGTKEEIEAIIAQGGATRVPALGLGGMDTSVPLTDE